MKDAKLRDVFNNFGKITGIEMHIADDVDGVVTVHWVSVPWDQALDELIRDNGLQYKIDGHKMYITKK